jgi:hypothetical protein
LAGREPITSALTVGRDLGQRRSAQRFPVVPWSGWGRRFDSGGGLHPKPAAQAGSDTRPVARPAGWEPPFARDLPETTIRSHENAWRGVDSVASRPPRRCELMPAVPRVRPWVVQHGVERRRHPLIAVGALLSSDDFGSSVERRSGGHPVYGEPWEGWLWAPIGTACASAMDGACDSR